jgi:hypothetical protein
MHGKADLAGLLVQDLDDDPDRYRHSIGGIDAAGVISPRPTGFRGFDAPAVNHHHHHCRRAKRWTSHAVGLVEAQIEYAAWLDGLPENLRDSALAEALQAICDLDLTELQAIILPRGFGRD